MSINIAADFGQKFYRLWKSVPVIAELNKTPVSKMRGSHVWRLFCLTGLQNLIYASFLLKIAASNRLLQLFRPWKNKPSSMQPDSQAVGFTKSLTWHHLLLKSKISHLHLLCTHIKWSKNWESGFRAAIKTPTGLSDWDARSSWPEATCRRQVDPLTSNSPPNPYHTSLWASKHKEPDDEGTAETVRMGTQRQPYCREVNAPECASLFFE